MLEMDDNYDIDKETAVNKSMLETRIPARLNRIYGVLTDGRQSIEQWQVNLIIDFCHGIDYNISELLRTIGESRLPVAAWSARNLLELWVWIEFCRLSRENAWRFHEDALRDMKGVIETQNKKMIARGMEDPFYEQAIERAKTIAQERLGLEDIDVYYLETRKAAEAVGLREWFAATFRFHSKFAHPTAGLIHGLQHQTEGCRQLQAVCTTEGVFHAAQGTLALEAQLGIPDIDP